MPITAAVLDALPRCRLVVRYGVGVDNVDLQAATERVWVANVPDYGRDEVADHTLALAMAMLRGWWRWTARSATAPGTWTRPGRCAAWPPSPGGGRRNHRHGVAAPGRRAGHARPRLRPPHGALEAPIERVPLEELLEEADLVSLHAALTPDTHHLVGAAALARMRPTAHLVTRPALRDWSRRPPCWPPSTPGRWPGPPSTSWSTNPPTSWAGSWPATPGWWPPPRRLVLGGGLPHLKSEVAREALRVLGAAPPLPGQHAGGPPMTPGATGGGEGSFLERVAAVPVVAILRAADAGRFLEAGGCCTRAGCGRSR